MLTLERKQELLAHAQKSLDKWNAREERYKSPSDGPPVNFIGCEEVIALMQELGIAPLEYIVTFKGDEYRLSDEEVTSLLPQESELSHMDGAGALTAQRIPEEQRQREVAEILRKTDEVSAEAYRTGKLPDLQQQPIKRHKGRKPGSKNKPKVVTAQGLPVGDFVPLPQPREFRPFGTHNRHADHQ